MQTLCLETCRLQGKDKALENAEISLDMLPDIRARAVRSYTNTTALDLLRNGPATRGSERTEFNLRHGGTGDVYDCLIEALRLDPPFLQANLDQIRERVRAVLTDDREPNIRSALQQYEDLFKGQTPPLDWDDEKRQLTIVDPHFYFYLRNG
jgi:hypothetical protein